ncbi:MAG: hypothetical protein JWP85_146 [Rhodoglobus sp.]|nr:hypothetical protein [Rhodoglobus sp.]
MRGWARDVFVAGGLPERAAAATADNLLFAESRGVKSHGLIRIPIYLSRISAGGIAADGKITIISDQGALLMLDGGSAIGAITALDAASVTVERARTYGIGCTIVTNANHFGAAGHYANLMADEGMYAIVVCNTDRSMCAPFGGRRVLGTNPLSIALPVANETRPQLDMATTQVSLGKLLVAAQDDMEIPLGWAVDSEGAPTTSATKGLEGALLPAGGAKGFGLAFMIDALVAVAGAQTSPDVSALFGDPTQPQRLGFAFIAINATGSPASSGAYAERVNHLVDEVHRSGPGPSGIDALVPGEPELAFEHKLGGVIDMSDGLIRALELEATRYGIPLPG